MQDDPEQSLAFIEKAREIEADEERPPADELIKARKHSLAKARSQIEAPGGSDIADFLQYNVYRTTSTMSACGFPSEKLAGQSSVRLHLLSAGT
ncbi:MULTISPECIES: hypothetical protein [unclassified Bradyrhizobium]|uniref:hypothetical protein n=1 Tax=unclassified Bradyrhizobium TaxID=2631580 RepID=UPI001CD76C12|nr:MULTISPECIES: hypothetical protein [unclassified Bradyrhizobium]MCA1385558.1 hypothetical protein [Bradyrhizobium sp. BRP05]MCA1507791.1 hypothetical protein [Bradyrhizobium sp. NBAIM02]MCA1393657.1 hypothetical protein [Bradyrhizobium sp. IC3123]MCA1422721.1 hypothetical protein [Bradyrhizobium sp. BRP23]MCA1479991.1 hypothetical protein [Bradyrhizobium sp. NBAIM08]